MSLDISFCASKPEFAELFKTWREEQEMRKYNPLGSSNIEALRERLRKSSSSLDDFETAESYFWFIELDAEKVGHVSIQNINRMMLTAEIGYGIDSSARSKGIASRSIRMISEQAFTKTPLRKLIAFVHEENTPSIRALEKAGFQREGLLREHYLVNNQPTNELIYGLLRQDLA